MFQCCKKFNIDISRWDVKNVTNTNGMFYECESFNKDISNWDISNVTNEKDMFVSCPIKEKYKPKFK